MLLGRRQGPSPALLGASVAARGGGGGASGAGAGDVGAGGSVAALVPQPAAPAAQLLPDADDIARLQADIERHEVGADVHARRQRVLADFLRFQAKEYAVARAAAANPLSVATPDHILAWLTLRAVTAGRKGADAAGYHWMAFSSVSNDLSALRDGLLAHFGSLPWDPQQGAGNPGMSPKLGKFLEGYRKRAAEAGQLPSPAAPVTFARVTAVLQQLAELVDTQPANSVARVKLEQTRVAILCGFMWGDRAADVLARKFEHLRVLPLGADGTASVEVTYYNDKSAKLSGHDIVKKVIHPLKEDAAMCPMWAIAQLSHTMRRAGVAHCDSGYVLRRPEGRTCVSGSEAMPSATLASRFRVMMRKVGVNPLGEDDDSFHGLRRGATQHLRDQGRSVGALMDFGRWRRESSMLLYLRDSPFASEAARRGDAVAPLPLPAAAPAAPSPVYGALAAVAGGAGGAAAVLPAVGVAGAAPHDDVGLAAAAVGHALAPRG